jgi:hypothetical protein
MIEVSDIQVEQITLDTNTDAGEFLSQNLWRAGMSSDMYKAAMDAICVENPSVATFAAAVQYDHAIMDSILQGLGEYGMEFESMNLRRELGFEDWQLAERGVQSAEAFVRAAQKQSKS